MFNFRLFDGRGSKTTAGVSPDHELCTINTPYPPFIEQKIRTFRQYLTLDGTAAGSNDMGVDGSVTNQEFYISADPNNDRYITSLNWLVGYGTSGQPYQWADGVALTNGTYLFYQDRHEEVVLHDAIKSNQDLFRLSFSPITTAWEVRGVNAGNDYGYFISMDLTKLGIPFGIKLDAGSTQKLVCRIRDNAGTAADTFNVIGYGFERFE